MKKMTKLQLQSTFYLHLYTVYYTLPETNSSPLKIDGLNTIVSFWYGLFSGAMLVLGRVDASYKSCTPPLSLSKILTSKITGTNTF